MSSGPILAILFLTSAGCRRESKLDFPQVQQYTVTAGDAFYFRPSDSQFVLVDRRKALSVAVAPAADVQAYAFDDRVTISRRRAHQPGEFIGAGGHPVDTREMKELTQTPMHVTVLAISTDGVQLAGGTSEGVVTIWNLSAGEQISQVTLGGPVRALAFSPDGKQLAVGLEPPASGELDTVQILDPATGFRVHTFGRTSTETLAWSKDGSQLTVGLVDGSLTFWDRDRGTRQVSLSTSPVVALAYHPSGLYLACAQADKRVTLLQLATDKKSFTFEPALPADPLFPRGIVQVDFNPAGTRLAVSYADGDQRIWDTSSLVPQNYN